MLAELVLASLAIVIAVVVSLVMAALWKYLNS
jgi:hypothetical protein